MLLLSKLPAASTSVPIFRPGTHLTATKQQQSQGAAGHHCTRRNSQLIFPLACCLALSVWKEKFVLKFSQPHRSIASLFTKSAASYVFPHSGSAPSRICFDARNSSTISTFYPPKIRTNIGYRFFSHLWLSLSPANRCGSLLLTTRLRVFLCTSCPSTLSGCFRTCLCQCECHHICPMKNSAAAGCSTLCRLAIMAWKLGAS